MSKIYIIISVIALLVIVTMMTISSTAGYRNITPEQAAEMLKSGKGEVLLLDVRTEGEFKKGHLKGSRLIPVASLPQRVGEIKDYRDRDIIVYCAVGGRSSKAAAFLSERGFKRVYNMEGGIRKWMKLGYEIVKEE